MRTSDVIAVATCAIVLALPVSAVAEGDVVALKNGDRLSGTIIKMDGKTLVITTPYAKDFGIVNDYDTEPAEDRKKNDFHYLGQIGYGF